MALRVGVVGAGVRRFGKIGIARSVSQDRRRKIGVAVGPMI